MKHLLLEWTEKATGLIHDYGTQLFYFDTTVVQLAPCLHPDHPSTIEENQEARRGIMRATATWACSSALAKATARRGPSPSSTSSKD